MNELKDQAKNTFNELCDNYATLRANKKSIGTLNEKIETIDSEIERLQNQRKMFVEGIETCQVRADNANTQIELLNSQIVNEDLFPFIKYDYKILVYLLYETDYKFTKEQAEVIHKFNHKNLFKKANNFDKIIKYAITFREFLSEYEQGYIVGFLRDQANLNNIEKVLNYQPKLLNERFYHDLTLFYNATVSELVANKLRTI